MTGSAGEPGDRLDPGADTQRAAGQHEVFVHGSGRDAQPFPDPGGRESFGGESNALPLTIGQTVAQIGSVEGVSGRIFGHGLKDRRNKGIAASP